MFWDKVSEMIKTNTRQLSEKESRPMIPLGLSKICKESIFKGIWALAQQIYPTVTRIIKAFSRGYYGVPDQGEYAADMIFRGRQRLIDIYPEMTEHALISFNASDVMTFLKKKLTGNF